MRQGAAEHPSDHAGKNPGEQRQRFFDKAALQADQAGDNDDGNNGPIDPGKGHVTTHRVLQAANSSKACAAAEPPHST